MKLIVKQVAYFQTFNELNLVNLMVIKAKLE